MTKSKSPEELRAEVVEARERLAGTVEMLAARADVKSRAQAKMAEAKGQLRERTSHVAHRVQDSTPQPMRTAAERAAHTGRNRPVPVAASAGGGGLLLLTALAVRRHRHHTGRG